MTHGVGLRRPPYLNTTFNRKSDFCEKLSTDVASGCHSTLNSPFMICLNFEANI